ncbi:MAG: alpha-galactosidase [Theionarchaea archaeon]|nr:alpha-galactosidase [Theionarchaea archaeon]
MNPTKIIPTTTSVDMNEIREFTGRYFSNSTKLPISFGYNNKAITGIPYKWNPVTEKRRIDANITETLLEGNDVETGLNIRIEVTEYRDYPVVEWLTWLENRGSEPTPIIKDLLAMNGAFAGTTPVLQHSTGDFYSEEGYAPLNTPLPPGDSMCLAPNGGRPCDGVFPYFRLNFDGSGQTLAVGWPGQWSAEFEGIEDGVLVKAGQERTNLRLMPGEKIRTPRVTVLSWVGDESRAINLWRRWYLSHILPRPNGRPIRPRLCCEGPGDGVEFTAATEENQLRFIPKAAERGIPFDIWWIDAGWYPCYNENGEREWPITGTWEPDPERFPEGLKRVSDCAVEHGADLLLWFEPERVYPGTKLDREHSEWLLRTKEHGPSGLLYLGNPECRQWLTEHVCTLIKENGIKIYRQDHNFSPLDYWRENDDPERQGIHENLHVQGYLQYWDDLLARNPGLWIDSCASGGRRNDLETMRRSVPLHYTDYGYGDHPVKLAFHHTLYAWIPFFREQAVSWDIEGRTRFLPCVDSFSFHCAMAPAMTTSLDIRRDDHDYKLARSMIEIWRRASPMLLNGDYYPLTPFHRSAEEWVVLQFDCPEMGRGLIQAIRFQKAQRERLVVKLKAIQPDRTYEFENPETGESRNIGGEQLIRDGFEFQLHPRSGSIWFYRT